MNPERERLIKGPSQKKRPRGAQSALVYSSSSSVNALKSNIRSVTRVLEHALDLPLDVRIEKERALAGYKQDLEKAQQEKEKQRMIKKYHMVRFFERQKATRNLKKLRTRLSSVQRHSPEHEALEIDIHNAEVDLNYALYHPLMQKYVGLFPRKGTHGDLDGMDTSGTKTARVGRDQIAMWAIVETCMEDGTLQALRDGKLRTGDGQLKPLQSEATKNLHHKTSEKQRKPGQSKTEATSTTDKQEDESDGGFFEE
ncbi:MAG: hypothetical protein Q9168_005042 [Polycauliona sp. 1 TL-2023]